MTGAARGWHTLPKRSIRRSAEMKTKLLGIAAALALVGAASPEFLHVADNRLCPFIDMNMLDTDMLIAAVPETAKGLDLD